MKTNCNAIVLGAALLLVGIASPSAADAQIAVRGNTVYTMAGPPIKNGVVVIRDGRITAIGTADTIRIPEG